MRKYLVQLFKNINDIQKKTNLSLKKLNIRSAMIR